MKKLENLGWTLMPLGTVLAVIFYVWDYVCWGVAWFFQNHKLWARCGTGMEEMRGIYLRVGLVMWAVGALLALIGRRSK